MSRLRCTIAGPSPRHQGQGAFTLLELVLVILLVAVLASLIIPSFNIARLRSEGVNCQANLRSLHTGFELYLQEHNRVWPKPPPSASLDIEASWWVTNMIAYGPTSDTWRCPSRKREQGQAPLGTLPFSIDYLPALFDQHPGTAYKWSGQPWLVEVGNYHGKGNFLIFPDGHIESASGVVVAGS